MHSTQRAAIGTYLVLTTAMALVAGVFGFWHFALHPSDMHLIKYSNVDCTCGLSARDPLVEDRRRHFEDGGTENLEPRGQSGQERIENGRHMLARQQTDKPRLLSLPSSLPHLPPPMSANSPLLAGEIHSTTWPLSPQTPTMSTRPASAPFSLATEASL
jgi:hypothetical protein